MLSNVFDVLIAVLNDIGNQSAITWELGVMLPEEVPR